MLPRLVFRRKKKNRNKNCSFLGVKVGLKHLFLLFLQYFLIYVGQTFQYNFDKQILVENLFRCTYQGHNQDTFEYLT